MIAAFAIHAPSRILFGRGRAAEAAGLVAAMGRRLLVVHGADAGRAQWLLDGLAATGAAALGHPARGEPTLETLGEAVAVARRFRADAVAALGGGAAIDLGKAVAALAPAAADPMDHLEVVGRGLPLAAAPLPFAAIPTTAGTGAEATRNAVIGVPAAGRKVSLRDDRMIARLAVIDPALAEGAPRGVTLASGLDALTQVIEPYLSTRASPYTDALCEAAIPAGLSALRQLMEREDHGSRDAMAWVALSGGLALGNAGLGAVHGLAGVAGGLVGAPHGALCGALLPHVLRLHAGRLAEASEAGRRLGTVRRMLAAAFDAADGIAALEHWMHAAGLPRLSALGLGADRHAAVAAAACASSSMKSDPSQPTAEELGRLLAAAG